MTHRRITAFATSAFLSCPLLLVGRITAIGVPAPDFPEIELAEPSKPPHGEEISDTFALRSNLQESLTRHLVSSAAIQELIEVTKPVYNLNRVSAGRRYSLLRDQRGGLHRFHYDVSDEQFLRVERGPDRRLEVSLERRQFDVENAELGFSIESSLWKSLLDLGERPALVAMIAGVLQWDIDFTLLRAGDVIRVLVERKSWKGRFVKYGEIQAVAFRRGSKFTYAFRFLDPAKGRPLYFDDAGKAVRKAFLKAPFQFSPRISSGFSYARLHPILKTRRPHLGIDYAAPTGTPVLASANGVVVFAGNKGGFGKMVQLRHPNRYLTSYAHLSKIVVRAGERIEQGEVIGKVGATGLATGPHLDYRVQDPRGKHVNPRNAVASPTDKPVDSRHVQEFMVLRDELMARLNAIPMRSASPRSTILAE